MLFYFRGASLFITYRRTRHIRLVSLNVLVSSTRAFQCGTSCFDKERKVDAVVRGTKDQTRRGARGLVQMATGSLGGSIDGP